MHRRESASENKGLPPEADGTPAGLVGIPLNLGSQKKGIRSSLN